MVPSDDAGIVASVHRIAWEDVPPHIRLAITDELGVEVVRADSLRGGYSPCLAARLDLSNGQSVFVKAVSSEQNPDSPYMVRREIDTMACLPADVPAPRLQSSIDDGEWIVGIFELVDGRLPTEPWTDDELALAFDALAELNAVEAPPTFLDAGTFMAHLFDGWRKLSARDAIPERWAARADVLVSLEARSLAAMDGDRLVHNDVRADNMLITPTNDVVFVDWAHACRGAPWLDAVLWACALELEGGGPPSDTIGRLDTRSRPRDDALLSVVAAIAGYFAHQSGLPDPPGLPTVRAFQRAQGEIADRWLSQLLQEANA